MTSKAGDQLFKPQSGIKGSTAGLKSRQKTFSASTEGKNVRSGIKGVSQQVSGRVLRPLGPYLPLKEMKLYLLSPGWMHVYIIVSKSLQ